MPYGWEEFSEDFEDATRAVDGASFQFFEQQLKNWFDVIDNFPQAALIVTRLEGLADFESWHAAGLKTVSSMVGSGSLTWPSNRDERLGLHIQLFRALANEKPDVLSFSSSFVAISSSRIDDHVSAVRDQFFDPMVNDLRRRFSRIQRQAEGDDTTVPASDRVVTLNHNSDAYKEAIDALDELERLLQQQNDGDPVEKKQRQTELSAGRKLLESVRVRVAAIMTVLIDPLRWILKTFTSSLLGKIATKLVEIVSGWLGLG